MGEPRPLRFRAEPATAKLRAAPSATPESHRKLPRGASGARDERRRPIAEAHYGHHTDAAPATPRTRLVTAADAHAVARDAEPMALQAAAVEDARRLRADEPVRARMRHLVGELAVGSSAPARDPRRVEATRAALLALARLEGRDVVGQERLDLWHAVHEDDGWFIVDGFEHQGRQYRVARASAGGLGNVRAPLSPREREVLAGIAKGQSNKRMAHDLGLSTSSVAEYVRRVARKLGAPTRVALVREASRRQAPPPPARGRT